MSCYFIQIPKKSVPLTSQNLAFQNGVSMKYTENLWTEFAKYLISKYYLKNFIYLVLSQYINFYAVF